MQEDMCRMTIDESLIFFSHMRLHGKPYLRIVYRDVFGKMIGVSTPHHYYNKKEGGVLIEGALMIFPFVKNKNRDKL